MPKLSIISVNLNNAEGLEKTIQSVVNQTFTDYEYLVIDGGSTDGSVDIIKKYAGKITYWVSEPDKGIYNAMNKGIKKAKGEWIYFLNTGDTFYTETVLSEIFSKKIKADVVYGNVFMEKDKIVYDGKFNAYKLMWKNICHQAIFFKKKVFDIVGYFDEQYKVLADREHNIRWFTNKKIKKIYKNKIFANYQQDGISEKVIDNVFYKNRIAINKNFNIILRQIANNKGKSFFSFLHKLLLKSKV